MILSKWPAWHRDHELTAEDLCGLEDYLLSRSQMLDENVFGIDSIVDWRTSIQFAWDPSANGCGTLTVSQVRGVTAGGQPVWLGDKDEPLAHPIGSAESQLQPGDLLDVWIDVNTRKPGSEKLTVDGTVPPKDPSEHAAMENLFLGRYKLPYPGGVVGLELVLRPFSRRLGAFGPVTDSDWGEWVKPLREKIEKLLAGNARTSALGTELARLAYEWPILPIPVLARRLRMVAWMHGREQFPSLPVDPAAVIDPFPVHDVQGHRLPEHLAALLPEGSSRTSGFGKSLHALLVLLAQAPVNFHAPIGSLKQWRDELAAVGSNGLSKVERDEVRVALGSPQHDDWSKAVALITAMNLEPSNRELASDCAEHLKHLYMANAAKGPSAGPMAFYCLAEAAKLQPSFPPSLSPILQQYFNRVRGRAAAATDRLLRYADREMGSGKVDAPVKPYAWWDKRSRRASGASLGEVRVVVAGNSGSGKSTLIARLLGVEALSPTTDGKEGAAGEIYGRITFQSGNLPTRIAEVDIVRDFMGSHSEAAREALADADLLILTIEPRDTYQGKLDALRELAVWTLQQQSKTSVAIAYTKADEYGVLESGTVRLIGEVHKDQIRAMQSAGNPDRGFRAFAEGRHEIATQERIEDGLRVFKQTTPAMKSTACRRHVLLGTQPLWVAVLGRLLNGYFIAAASREAYLDTNSRRGIAHLAADALEFFKGSKS